MKKSLLKLINKYYGALVLEDVVSHKARKFLVHFCGTLCAFLLIGAVFTSGELSSRLRGAFLGSFFLFLFFFILEVYFYSAYKARRVKKDLLSFEAARMIFYSQDDDLTVGFLYCETGDEAMRRLGFSEDEIRNILRDRPAISFSEELLDLSAEANLYDLMHLIFEKDLFFQHTLDQKGISFDDFFHTVRWVLEKEEREIFDARWWSMEKLQRIAPIGKTWSHGKTFSLSKYGTDLTESGLSHFASYEALHDENVLKIEDALGKKKDPNVCLVTEEEFLGNDLVFMLARRIRENRSLHHLSRSRVFLIDSELLFKEVYNKISFETEFYNLLNDSKKARNMVLVFSNWGNFVKRARSLGADALSVFKDFLNSSVRFVFLESKKDFEENLNSGDESPLSQFETIFIKENDNRYFESFLEKDIEDFEFASGLLFTYKSIEEIIKILKKDFKNCDLTEKAKDLMLDAIKRAKEEKRRFVLPEDLR